MSAFALALETSNPALGSQVALARVQVVPQEPSSVQGSKQRHALQIVAASVIVETLGDEPDDVVQAIARVCRRAGARPSDLKHVAVSVGPGGFTSVRIAVTAARMIAEVSGASLVGVPTPVVAATQWGAQHEGRVLVLLASKGDSAFASVFCVKRNVAAESAGACATRCAVENITEQGTILTAKSLAHSLALMKAQGQLPAAALGDEFVPVSMRDVLRDAGVMLQQPQLTAHACLLASCELASVDPLQLSPIYPREPEAVTKWRERANKGER